MQMQLKILAHLDKLKSLPPDPPCLISGGMSFCVWPHEGSTALKIEDCRLRGRRMTAGAVGEQSMEMYTQNKRTTWTPVHQNHSSSDRWKLEQKQNSFISNTTIRDVYIFFLSQTSKNILLWVVLNAFTFKKGLWVPSMSGLNIPLPGARFWGVGGDSSYPDVWLPTEESAKNNVGQKKP